MHKYLPAITAAVALTLAGSVAFAQQAPSTSAPGTVPTAPATGARDAARPTGALGEDAIRAAIARAGYTEIRKLKLDDGVWEAKARRGTGPWRELKIGPVTGKIYPEDAPSRLNADEIKARLAAAGYSNIHDVKFDDGLWSVDAVDPHGRNMDLLVDPDNGSVVAAEPD